MSSWSCSSFWLCWSPSLVVCSVPAVECCASGGTAAILRDIPAVGGHGWRHGVIRYRGGEAVFYRLSSLRWWPDRRLSRRGLEIVSRRAPRGDEFDIMTDEIVILELRDTTLERPIVAGL